MPIDFSVDLPLPIPEELRDEFIKKIPYVSTALTGYQLEQISGTKVYLQLGDARDVQPDEVARRVVEVAEKMARGFRPATSKMLVSRRLPSLPYQDDPHHHLEREDQLFHFGQGRYGFGPQLNRLFAFFEREITALARSLDAPEFRFPSMVGADTLERCRYIRSFPSSLTFVTHLREELPNIRNFSRDAHLEDDRLLCDHKSFADVRCLLCPTVCFNSYAWLADREYAEPFSITALGKCFRYESQNLTGLERLWDFTMREVIVFGTKDYALELRQRIIDLTAELLSKWGLSFEIRSATDPFFVDDYASLCTFQAAFDLKFEILAPLPYRGKDVALGSFNYAQDFFGRSFNITEASGNPMHTACVGWGYERLALALMSQYGPELNGWPAYVANRIA
jgi:seryl-tRNA synthetase